MRASFVAACNIHDMVDSMATEETSGNVAHTATMRGGRVKRRLDWKEKMMGKHSKNSTHGERNLDVEEGSEKRPPKWNMGILNDRQTEEVPGSILLLSKVSEYNEPLGMRNAPARTSASSFPYPHSPSRSSSVTRNRYPSKAAEEEKKLTADGKIVLEPQPDDSLNDPLNWKVWRRDVALLSLGFYCMVGGGMTPILAAGFDDIAEEYDVSVPRVALTTGLYMMGLGLGSVVLSPTAILYGKRPVYLVAAVCFILSSVWCALSPNFASLVVARIFQGFAVSSVECLPSATVAEIYFLHEKAYRLGIYTLLLLGGKNLVPLVSAAVIQSLGWRWVFWVVAIVVGFGLVLLFFFVPETFWDRTPIPHNLKRRRSMRLGNVWKSISSPASPVLERKPAPAQIEKSENADDEAISASPRRAGKHAHFQAATSDTEKDEDDSDTTDDVDAIKPTPADPLKSNSIHDEHPMSPGYFGIGSNPSALEAQSTGMPSISRITTELSDHSHHHDPRNAYTKDRIALPPKSFIQQLRPWSGRLRDDKWFRVAIRPFILFAYPSILWSSLVYALSIGWLIVLSESVSTIYISRDSYNFTPLQAGLVYISPFVGGILGTAVAGKVSDLIVRYLSRRNGGVYEPEFRLVMAIPITISTTIGLMGFGWSAQERDAWIVPTVFFGIISFGCSLGSTTAITFAVDSYRQYAGEALVTLNFSKNILHGLVFSLFFNHWLESEGSKDVFIAIGGIQLGCMLTTIPMYVYGKRARMWTVRKNLMEKF